MNNEILFQLFNSFRTGNEEEMMTASNELLKFYFIPDSLPILTTLYLSTDDLFYKKSILIGLRKALNDKNLSNISAEHLKAFQDNLVEMLTHEKDKHLLEHIKAFFVPVLRKFKESWDSLDNYIESYDESYSDYFYIFNIFATETKTEADCDGIIEFALPKLQQVFQDNSSPMAQLSAFCFISTISFKMNHNDFLWNFVEEFRNFFLKIRYDQDHLLLISFKKLISYIELGLGTSEFSKRVCPLNDILEYCLSPKSDYWSCINLRIFINESLMISETEVSALPDLLINLLELSKKFYSTEIDIQTQQIDDYFHILKYIPFEQRQDICISIIEELIGESDPSSICTALSLFRGAVISGITFDKKGIDFFMQCYNIDDLKVKIFASSIFSDICEELSTEIEENADSLLFEFCQNLNASFELSIEEREQFVLSVFNMIQSTLLFCTDFSDETCENLLKTLLNYIQNGTKTEQSCALNNLFRIAHMPPHIALNQEVFNLLIQMLQVQDSDLKSFLYEFLTIYIDFYPNSTNLGAILEAISNESDEDCYVYTLILGHIALKFNTNEQIKEFVMSKIQLILNELFQEEDENQNLTDDHRGCAISSLFYIMSAYVEIIPQIFPNLINSIANIIAENELNDTNINFISKGIETFTPFYQSVDYRFDEKYFEPIFVQIINKIGSTNNIIDTESLNDNIFELLDLMTNFVKCSDIPCIDYITRISLIKFTDLMKSDEKKDLRGIQIISRFLRKVFESYDSEPMKMMGNQIVTIIFKKLTTNQSSSALEGHMLLILCAIVSNQIECFSDIKSELTAFLIEKMTNSAPNIAKNIAYFFKTLAESKYLMDFIEEDQDNFKLLWNSLVERLTKDCESPTLLYLNDNIISALVKIEKKFKVLQIDEFFEIISPYLPSYSDTDELADIYSPLIKLFPKMNAKNQNNFVDILIKFFSYPQSSSFFSDVNDTDNTEVMVLLFNILNAKLESVDDAEQYINSNIVKGDYNKSAFSYNFNYIGMTTRAILDQKKEDKEDE